MADEAATALRLAYPGLRVVGAFAGRAGLQGDAETRARIGAAGRVDVILVAYGAGRQERWLDRNLVALNIPVGLGIGGVLNFLAGARRGHRAGCAAWSWSGYTACSPSRGAGVASSPCRGSRRSRSPRPPAAVCWAEPRGLSHGGARLKHPDDSRSLAGVAARGAALAPASRTERQE